MNVSFFGARSDRTGLGNQWEALARLLQPKEILLIDSTPFNGNPQYPERYEGFNVTPVRGFPSDADTAAFVRRSDKILTIETPYNRRLFQYACSQHKPTFLMFNWEFLDNLKFNLAEPDIFLAPSRWHIEDMERLYPKRVRHLPPPLFPEDFAQARKVNIERTGRRRFLFVHGRTTHADRNGLLALLAALRYARTDFELVIASQVPLGVEVPDQRVTIDYSAPDDHTKLYEGFDALILPRRYGGLCLPCNEALMSGLPIVMTHISPNSELLPDEWLVPARKSGEFMARTMIDTYDADPTELAARIDWLATMPDEEMRYQKDRAYSIASTALSAERLRSEYEEILE